ncbi:MAG: hypothetical protein WD894_16000 [Pirellulales bacterium]
MSRWCLLLVCWFAVCAGSTSTFADEPFGKPVLIEGTWTHSGPRSIIGSGADRTVTVKKVGDDWTITLVTTHYPSVREKDAKPREQREGPYPVHVDDQDLVFTREKGKVPARYTFLCAPERLIMPAIVQKKPGLWEYRYEYQSFRIKCEDDPFKTPVGKAQISGVRLGKGYHSYEEAPRSRFWPRARYLRFLERSDEGGQLFERFRLIFDDYGWPRYERLFETGERSTNDYEIPVYLSPRDGR